MIDGIPLVDAHLHPAHLSTLKMPVQEWAAGFNSLDGIYDAEGAVIPSAFDAYLEAEGVDVAVPLCEYSPLSTGVQPVENLLPLLAANPGRMRLLANVNPHLHHPLVAQLDPQPRLRAGGARPPRRRGCRSPPATSTSAGSAGGSSSPPTGRGCPGSPATPPPWPTSASTATPSS